MAQPGPLASGPLASEPLPPQVSTAAASASNMDSQPQSDIHSVAGSEDTLLYELPPAGTSGSGLKSQGSSVAARWWRRRRSPKVLGLSALGTSISVYVIIGVIAVLLVLFLFVLVGLHRVRRRLDEVEVRESLSPAVLHAAVDDRLTHMLHRWSQQQQQQQHQQQQQAQQAQQQVQSSRPQHQPPLSKDQASSTHMPRHSQESSQEEEPFIAPALSPAGPHIASPASSSPSQAAGEQLVARPRASPQSQWQPVRQQRLSPHLETYLVSSPDSVDSAASSPQAPLQATVTPRQPTSQHRRRRTQKHHSRHSTPPLEHGRHMKPTLHKNLPAAAGGTRNAPDSRWGMPGVAVQPQPQPRVAMSPAPA